MIEEVYGMGASTTNDFQYTSLIVSIIVILSMIILAKHRKSARLFYMSMIFGWLPGIIYYTIVLFFNNDFIELYGYSLSHSSSILRMYQYFIFGGWFVFDAVDISIKDIFEKIKLYKIEKIRKENKEWEGDTYE